MEKIILAALLKERACYETFKRIGQVSELSPLASALYRAAEEYYDADKDARSISKEFIESRMLRDVKNPKHESVISDFVRGLSDDVSAVNVEREIRELHRQFVTGRLSLALANGEKEEEIQKLWKDRQEGASQAADKSRGLIDVLDTTDLEEGEKENVEYIKLWPKALNDYLDGGAIRGHHILVYARPETGKTLFAINLCAGFLHQGLNIIYVGNEEPAADIRDRIRGRLLKVSKNDVRRDPRGVLERLSKVELGKVHILESASFGDVRACLAGSEHAGIRTCDVIVIDQVRNMRIKSDGRTAELEAAGIEARSIAKEFNVLVLSITQAGDSATNKIYLDMSDVDSSKTGIPASADLMIGLGQDFTMKETGMMGISLPKNKLSGLHSRFLVQCNYSSGVIS